MRSRTSMIAGLAVLGLLLMGPAPGALDGRLGKVREVSPGAKLERSDAPKAAPEATPKLEGRPVERAPRNRARTGLDRPSRPATGRVLGLGRGGPLTLPPGVTAEVEGTVALLSNGERVYCTCDQICDYCQIEIYSPGLSCEGVCGRPNSTGDAGAGFCESTSQPCTWGGTAGRIRGAPLQKRAP